MSTAPADDLYEEDFFAWTQAQASELRRFARTRPNLPLDLDRIAEEIQDLGRERRDALRSWTLRILEHLLLLEHSPAEEPRRGWAREVTAFRNDIDTRLTTSLRRDLKRQLPRLYARARRNLVSEFERYGEAEVAKHLPERCPYTLEEVLSEFWPGGLTNDGSGGDRSRQRANG